MFKELTIEDYLMDRDKQHTLSEKQKANAIKLIDIINDLGKEIISLGYEINFKISSGWRPAEINEKVGGAKNSAHTTCEAIDLIDIEGILDAIFLKHPDLLIKRGLWQEHPFWTRGWCHLDIRVRTQKANGLNVFVPYTTEPKQNYQDAKFIQLPRL